MCLQHRLRFGIVGILGFHQAHLACTHCVIFDIVLGMDQCNMACNTALQRLCSWLETTAKPGGMVPAHVELPGSYQGSLCSTSHHLAVKPHATISKTFLVGIDNVPIEYTEAAAVSAVLGNSAIAVDIYSIGLQ